jgi:antitoxin component YwqK of YwqJK toxin-antitoxin module
LTGNIFGQDTTYTGYKKFYFPNGNISSEGNLLEGKPDGYWKNYYENGKLKSEGNRFKQQLDGLWKFYHESGKISVAFEYKEGKKNGVKKVYDIESGLVISEEKFVNDVRDGLSFYFKEGFKFKEVPFVKSKEEGVGKEFDKNGTIITIITYKNGFVNREEKINRVDKFGKKQGIWKEFYPDGSVHKEMKYRDDLLDGYYKEFAKDGNLILAQKYIEGVLQKNVAELVKLDVKNTYHANGRIKTSGTSNKGVPEGITRKYDEEGKITGGELYKEGYLIGEGVTDEKGYKQGKWKEFYNTGQLKGEGEYLNDRRIGEWIYYYQNGKIEQRGSFTKDGKPTGDWKWFYDSGNLLREESFIRGLPEGVMIEYSDSGAVITKGLFTEGLKEGAWFMIDGDEKEEGEYRNGEKEGLWKVTYTGNGKVVAEGIYITGLENGKFSYYHYNGRLREEGSYIMGVKDASWRRYDTEGVLLSTFQYENGQEVKIDGVKVPYNSSIEDP